MDFSPAVLPPELRPYRQQVEAYTNAKLQRFAYAFAGRLNPNLTKDQIDYVATEVLHAMGPAAEPVPMVPQQNLRLVLRHDCLSSGCGDNGCTLCQYNPSRICKRNLKQKYLIDDHLRAKCGAGLRVEVVDENGQCMVDPLPDMELEVHVLNGEKYKEVCPDNTLLNSMQLRSCIIQPNHKKPLLKRESAMGVSDEARIFLPVENGQAPLSDLQCTTSSEALLAGKAPTFRLLVWAIDRTSNHLSHITYVVSESFVVATKRVKHAIKSDIPSISDHVSKLVHIGKATVDKLQDLRQAGAEENMDVDLPEHLNRVEKVGQFRELVERTEQSSDLKHKLRHLLKLSPEKWEEVTQHALSAVVPDFRPRVWWAPSIGGGLLFACKNGAVMADHPLAFVHKDGQSGAESLTPVQQADGYLFNLLPKLKQQAMQDWFAPGHTGWDIYWQDPADPLAQQLQPGANGPTYMQQLPRGVTAAALFRSNSNPNMAAGGAAAGAAATPTSAGLQGLMQPPQGLPYANGTAQQLMGQPAAQHLQQQQQPQQQYPPSTLLTAMQPGRQQQQFQQQFQPQQQQQDPHLAGVFSGVAPKFGSPSVPGAVGMPPGASAANAASVFGSAAPNVRPVNVPLPGQQRHSVPGYNTVQSPFATRTDLQHTLSAAFPNWGRSSGGGVSSVGTPHSQQQGGTPGGSNGGTGGGAAVTQGAVSGGGAVLPQQGEQQHQQQQQPNSNGNTVMQQQQYNHQQQHHQQYPGQLQAVSAPPNSNRTASAAVGIAGAPAGVIGPGGASLEMLNTEDLPPIDRGPSAGLWSLDSFQQMQMLAELPSVGVGSMLAEMGQQGSALMSAVGQNIAGQVVGQQAQAVGNGNAAGAAAAGGVASPHHDRALSLKFSMSLDLADVPDDIKGGGVTGGGGN